MSPALSSAVCVVAGVLSTATHMWTFSQVAGLSGLANWGPHGPTSRAFFHPLREGFHHILIMVSTNLTILTIICRKSAKLATSAFKSTRLLDPLMYHSNLIHIHLYIMPVEKYQSNVPALPSLMSCASGRPTWRKR